MLAAGAGLSFMTDNGLLRIWTCSATVGGSRNMEMDIGDLFGRDLVDFGSGIAGAKPPS